MSKFANALNSEIGLHRAVLFALVLPLYCLVVPQYFLMRSTVDGYAAARLVINRFSSQSLPPVQALLFSGQIVQKASLVLLIFLFFGGLVLFARRTAFRRGNGLTASPPFIDQRLYRKIPAQYESAMVEFLRESWIAANASGTPPKLYCFVATSVMACAFSDGGEPAIAISTGMIERWSQGDKNIAKLILLHEISHVVFDDEKEAAAGRGASGHRARLHVWAHCVRSARESHSHATGSLRLRQ